jgi:hypothetical protein
MQITKPRRIRHSHTQSLIAPPDRVFPLLCPVRETEWAQGWEPKTVISESGLMEQGCLFVTPDEDAEAVWITVRHDPQAHYLELLKVVPDHTVCRFEITLTPEAEGRSAAGIAYTCTALGPAGDAFLDGFTGAWYREFMEHWETALNHYLEHGTMLATVSFD